MKPARITTLAVVLSTTALVSHASLVNRWSFNNASGSASAGTVTTDSISSANGVVVGVSASFTGTGLTLPGTTTGNFPPSTISAYVDLPNGLISSKSNLTIECWATVVSAKSWQRLFDFGKMNIAGMGSGAEAGEIKPDAGSAPGAGIQSTDGLMLAVNRGTTANTQRQSTRAGGAGELAVDSGATINYGTEYHFAIVVQDGVGTFGSSGAQVRWYLNGAPIQTNNLNFHLRDIADVNNWLGRSNYSSDTQANVTYNEFRIYDHAMTRAEVTNSMTAGANATFPPPATQPDSVTINFNHKARIPVLANDSNYAPSTVIIATPPAFGSATPDSLGRILYVHTNGTPGSDSFTYRVNGAGGTSAVTTVTINFTTNLRLTNNTLNVPQTPPATAYQFANAFPNLSFSQPLGLAVPPGETNRLFVLEKTGLLRVITNTSSATPGAGVFLNLPTLLSSRGETLSSSGEQGLLGLAFHPGYATNGYCYIYYSVTSNSVVRERLSRFSVSGSNSNAANTASEVILFQQPDTAVNHNGGDLHFGPDGYLYISLGDGGDQNDSQGHAQKIDDGFYAGIARIDVDKRPGSLAPNVHSHVPLYSGSAAYAVPPDNPYVGATNFNGATVNSNSVFTELWAVGLRNPWRFSFDPATSNLWCGNVGQNTYEGVFIVTNKQNCGWAFYEQNHTGPKYASRPAGFTYTPAVWEYSHGSGTHQGSSVTGGFVYRGARIPSLQGYYICADYVSGNVWALWLTNGVIASSNRITGLAGIVSFLPDPANSDVLAANISSGQIVRLTTGTPAGTYPANLSDTGIFADVTDLSPAPGVMNYTPNMAFWSDYGVKSRWFIINDTTRKMTWSRDGLWTFPTNQIWIKHFDMEMTRGNPATKRRIETRLIVRTASAVYGVSYQWNTNQTDAALVPDAGADFPLVITNASITYTQQWHIPSRAECLACHTPQGGHALSFTTRQINRDDTMNNLSGNQLELLAAAGYFSNAVDSVNTMPHHVLPDETNYPLETRVRSFLDVNCAYCHRPGGTSGGSWDGRASTPLFDTGIINGSAINNGGDSTNKLIVPRDTLHSIILNRVAATNGFTRMPPLATSELDQTNISLLAGWIQSFDTNRLSFADWQTGNLGSTNTPPSADADNDALSDFLEYLYGTPPLVAQTNFHNPTISVSTSAVATVSFQLSPNATAQVQSSANLFDWSPWDIPGNDGLPQLVNPQTVQGPATNDVMFFRLLLNQR